METLAEAGFAVFLVGGVPDLIPIVLVPKRHQRLGFWHTKNLEPLGACAIVTADRF